VIDGVQFFCFTGNRIDRALVKTNMTPGAAVINAVLNQGLAYTTPTFLFFDMFFVLFPEITQGTENRVRRGTAQLT
jgi:hypothetical protein